MFQKIFFLLFLCQCVDSHNINSIHVFLFHLILHLRYNILRIVKVKPYDVWFSWAYVIATSSHNHLVANTADTDHLRQVCATYVPTSPYPTHIWQLCPRNFMCNRLLWG